MFQIFAQLFQAAPEQTYLPRLLCFLPFARRSRIWNSLLNDAVPWPSVGPKARRPNGRRDTAPARFASHAGLASLNRLESVRAAWPRSEEHTSELQSRLHLVCRLLLEKKKRKQGTRALRG